VAVFDGSRYARAVRIEVVAPDGSLAQPPYLDVLPRLRTTTFPDNRVVDVTDADWWHTLAFRFLGDARAWWAIAELSGVVDPFAEIDSGQVVTIPSQNTYHFTLLGET
jgi:nucleoid-associated protein YgaU